ncbi:MULTISPECIES: winged helix-turn-helix transcriptional regulator [Acidithiobacillus]|jgi:Predicted transcriptional regulators|uniref:Transcriptional regulator n=2 Tax=Acidithiobacillus TaxID=119977 RepID=A0A179BHI4_ACIFR|nr:MULTISPECIES: helix-turn-helix domain-containing protein [Acidithiobacillus]MBU2829956.1 helix-turn-helix transcriptional regulator [Acidithiobacillus ferriphilus]MBU2831589.1 helix-turn-helix transcriptional regulator [Acidithiobacillus ferriphilus]MBU2849028.1 helix-turn-helix transcriptional regulator [Acidithiobacillus ferriphilus]MBU2852567.1 helix-turn-helix transcriptional regulator [Acidithiobacillus ferriphilus]MBW9249731.1 transcriptional regulator [Acidithiobacillus ferriphilus]
MTRQTKQEITCPMDALLRLLMGPWTTYILWTLRQRGPLRFGVLKREVRGISSRMLTERLRTLEEAQVIFREYYPSIPPEVTYGLTRRGLELREVLDALDTLARRWDAEDTDGEVIAPELSLAVTN